jgi:predicted O-methyltransferase YrrM
MDSAFAAVVATYDERMAAEREDRTLATDERLLAVGEKTATLLNLLGKSIQAPRILELGTSYGYSTLWLAEAARATGGRVVTLELRAAKQDYARAALAKAGLAAFVEFRTGDALDILPTLEGPFDLVLVDLWKDLYVPCLDLFYPKLAPGALIVADNMLFPPSNEAVAAEYRRAVRAKPNVASMLLPVGQGIELSRFTAGLPARLT